MFKLKQYTISDGLGNIYYVFARTKWGARRRFEQVTGMKGSIWLN